MNREQYISYLIKKELSYLEDNKYRYQLDNKDHKHDKIIGEHDEKIEMLINK